jgi:predicted nucleic acid-binding protein
VGRPSNFASIYLDSCALIAVFQTEPGSEPIADVLIRAAKDQVKVFASTIILVEVRGQRKGQADEEIDRKTLDHLRSPSFIYVEASQRVAMRARRYCGQYGLKPMDAIHLASAVEAEAQVMWTLDKGFGAVLGTSVEGVWVDQPYEAGQAFLFTPTTGQPESPQG